MNESGLWGNIVAWFQQPFKSDGSALDWTLFLGLLIVISFMWQLILLEITRVGE